MPEWLSTGWWRYLLHYAAKFKKICKPFCGTFFGVEYCWATQCTRMFWRQNSSSPSIADCDHAVRGDPRVRAGRHGGELCGVGRGADRGQHAPRRLQLIHQLRILLRRHRSMRHIICAPELQHIQRILSSLYVVPFISSQFSSAFSLCTQMKTGLK